MIAGAPRSVAPFSHAVEADGWVFLTGQMPTDPAAPRPGAGLQRAGVAALAVLALLAGPAPAPATPAETVAVPSGQPVTLLDVIGGEPGDEGLTLRFRFIAPAIARVGGTVDFATAEADMQHLCDTYALPRVLAGSGPRPERIVIALSDRPVPFGALAPEATQFFEVYSIADGTCQWEPF
jgi:hypothetical protein